MTRVLYLTNNPNLGSTARILQSWLTYGPGAGVGGCVVVQTPGPIVGWLSERRVEHMVCPMRRVSVSWPVPGLADAWRVARWARRRGVDIIHCNEHDTFPFASQVRWLFDRPMVCHVRFGLKPEFARWAFGKRRPPEALLWTSHFQKNEYGHTLAGLVPESRQHVVRLGLDLKVFGARSGERTATRSAWKLPPDAVAIGTASALRPRKRLHEFIDLIAALAREDAHVVGVVAGDAVPGDEGYKQKLYEQVRAAGLEGRFRWLGNLDDVEPFMHAIDVFVSTSELETFGNSVCEAMACSRAAAGYVGGSVQEVIGDAGLVVPTGDLAGLTDAVRRLVRDEGLRRELGDHARRRVAEVFDPAASFRQLQAIYAGLP